MDEHTLQSSMQGYTPYFINSVWVIKYSVPSVSVLYLTFPVQLRRCLQMKCLREQHLENIKFSTRHCNGPKAAVRVTRDKGQVPVPQKGVRGGSVPGFVYSL